MKIFSIGLAAVAFINAVLSANELPAWFTASIYWFAVAIYWAKK